MLHPVVFNTSELCAHHGVRYAVMSPGSRNAPLTLSFARNDKVKKFIIPDERSAAFVGIGVSQVNDNAPVALCCTSGTALLNYGPAVAEAYYRQIPLVVFSADRPPELIDQRDGQTIRQFEALKNHVKASYQLPVVKTAADAELYQRILEEGINAAKALPPGPVHFNIPFEEPFYPETKDELTFIPFKESATDTVETVETDIPDLDSYRRVLLLIGQHQTDLSLEPVIKEVSGIIPVISPPLSNQKSGIQNTDAFIDEQTALKPDLLITYGLSVLSKKLKNFIRNHKPEKHFHLDPAGVPVDTFETSPEILRMSLATFLKSNSFPHADSIYRDQWITFSEKAGQGIDGFLSGAKFSEIVAVKSVLDQIPEGSNVHLANSMPVRYPDLLGVPKGLTWFSNRGTSGIDGCTSTAVGSALMSEKLNVLITGDLAFLYDRNAFFHNYTLPNLRVIVLNNQGGGIFRLIKGPSQLPELETYFETRHNKTARYICEENSMNYQAIRSLEDLNDLSNFWTPSENGKILEIFTDPDTNQSVYKELRKTIYEQIKN
ncbi:MAG: 2-succinyl-5-enolpyruvyl-6-hydroxy-3-cyclohexene-1-carboxylic-acid synthase [Ekhidna sp.]